MTEYLDHPAINPKQSKHWALDIAVAFPTLRINLSPGGFWSHRFWPTSVNRTRWEAEFHVPKPLTGREKLQQELYITRIAEILLEDVTNRSEEHTSDLKSLMRHSYAVFCLKKKIYIKQNT